MLFIVFSLVVEARLTGGTLSHEHRRDRHCVSHLPLFLFFISRPHQQRRWETPYELLRYLVLFFLNIF